MVSGRPAPGRERTRHLHGGLFRPDDGGRAAGELSRRRRHGAIASYNTIRYEMQSQLPTSNDISSAYYTCNPDHLHFNSSVSREFGKRYGENVLLLMGVEVAKPK